MFGQAERSTSVLEDTICQLAAGCAAIHRVLLQHIVEFDLREAWRADGATSMAAWLSYRLNLTFRTAAEWIRVAHALEALPYCARAYAEGRLSWDQLAPLTEIATPETDEEMAERAPGLSAYQLERAARWARRLAREQAEAAHGARFVRWWFFEDGSFRLRGRLPAAEGAVVAAELKRLAESLPQDDCLPDPHFGWFEQRCADALVGLCSSGLASAPDSDRATVVVHADAAALSGKAAGGAGLDDGTPLQLDVVRRLACDCHLELVVEGPDGAPLGVGRRTRSIPPWLGRQLRRRDGGCRFPGCGLPGWLEGHHVRHWAADGPTDLDNLVSLCSSHHRLVHELGWDVRTEDRRLVFQRPDGSELATGPPPLRPKARRMLGRAIRAPALLAG